MLDVRHKEGEVRLTTDVGTDHWYLEKSGEFHQFGDTDPVVIPVGNVVT